MDYKLLLAELDSFKGMDDFYIGDKIPPNKLQNAKSIYFTDGSDQALALIDCTVFGSAKNGMVIGLKGLYWKNDFGNATFFSWDNFKETQPSLINKFSDKGIILKPDMIFGMAGSQAKPETVLKALTKLAEPASKYAAQIVEADATPVSTSQVVKISTVENIQPEKTQIKVSDTAVAETMIVTAQALHKPVDMTHMPNFNSGKFTHLSNNTFIKWFVGVNIGVMVTAMIIFQSFLGPLVIMLIGFAGSFISLFISKFMAMKVHNIEAISTENFHNENEKLIYEMIKKLADKAGLPCTPAVGIYQSPDMNAFATGASQKDSLVAFSSALIEQLPYQEVEAIAAHEISHIANRDMLGMVLIQGAINTLIYIVTIPLRLAQVFYLTTSNEDDNGAVLIAWGLKAFELVAHIVIMAIGTLFSLAFSRKREYRADNMAAMLVGAEPMIAALTKLKGDEKSAPIAQADFAAFKVSGKISWAEIFSTHPEMDKRIDALKVFKSTEL